MNNKKYKTTMGTIGVLMLISGGMFAYENVYKVKQAEENKVTIYVAKEDVQAHTKVTADMFKPLDIDNTSVLGGYVLDLNSVVGKELKGGLLKGEPLTAQRLQDAGDLNNGELVLKILPDSVGDVLPNDNVKVYVQLQNSDTGEITIKELFANKKVIGQQLAESALLATNQEKATDSFNIYATEAEVKDYYVAKQSGSIIVVKINDLDTENISTDKGGKKTDKFDADSEDVKNSTKENDAGNEGQAIVTYTVKSGDTLEGLALKFKTKKETISSLNNGKTEFNEGEMIQVPAN